jgi:hypothetical protein
MSGDRMVYPHNTFDAETREGKGMGGRGRNETIF